MSIDSAGIVSAVTSHAKALGVFSRVNGHEPKNAPGNGLTVAVWAARLAPVAEQSGLAATSALLVLNVRIYTSMTSEPQDAIDPNILNATDRLLAAFNGDFTLGGAIAYVDVFGRFGTKLEATAGYLNQDNKMFRAMVLTIPLVINDAWEQVA